MTERIKVMIRLKPFVPDNSGHPSVVLIDQKNNTITLSKNSLFRNTIQKYRLTSNEAPIRMFTFNRVFSQRQSQQKIYQQGAFQLIENVLQGYNGTIFVYGQTGSGKTHTMMGQNDYFQKKLLKKIEQKQKQELFNSNLSAKAKIQDYQIERIKGIIPRSFNQIIATIKSQKEKKHLIECSFIEIYNENVHDLLGNNVKDKIGIKETPNQGLVLENLKKMIVKNVADLQKCLRTGYKNRKIRETSMNKESSRSHCIFTIKIQEEEADQFGNVKFKVGKLNLVDLAGSERQSKTHIMDEGLKEATKINLSLSALGKVINILSSGRDKHIPYRDSKLTRILQDSLGGNTKTVMIATISQSYVNFQQTLSTLVYASRAKYIQNKPIVNQDPKDVLLREYAQEIKRLRELLEDKQMTILRIKQIESKKTHQEVSLMVNQEELLRQEKQNQMQKEEILKKIENLENLVKKQEQIGQEQGKEIEKIAELKQKLKIKAERQIELENQKKLREEQLITIQKEYKNLNEEVDKLRVKFTDLREKYLQKCEQLKQNQQQRLREQEQFHQILDTQNKQIQKYQTILKLILEKYIYSALFQDANSESTDQEDRIPPFKVIQKANIQLIHEKHQINLINLHPIKESKISQKKIQNLYEQMENYRTKKSQISHSTPFRRQNIQKSSSSSGMKSPSNLNVAKQIKYESARELKNAEKIFPKVQSKVRRQKSINEPNNGKGSNLMKIDMSKIKDQILNQLRQNKKNRIKLQYD